jgi:hypothetical protein
LSAGSEVKIRLCTFRSHASHARTLLASSCLGQLFHVPHCLTGAHNHMLRATLHVKVLFCIPSFCPLAMLSALLTRLSSGVLPAALRRWYTFDMLPVSGTRPSCSCIRRAWFFDSCCSCSAVSSDRSLEFSLDWLLLKVLRILFDALVFREDGEEAGGEAGSAGSTDEWPIPPSMEDRSMPSRAIGLLVGRSRGACRSSTAVKLMVSSLGLPCRGIMVRRSAARVCCMGGDRGL